MSEHTPEPWDQTHRKTKNGMYSTEIYDSDGETIATLSWYAIEADDGLITNREANAQRIVDCVNAMKGIKDVQGFMEIVKVCIKMSI